jgi:hypothetical protein
MAALAGVEPFQGVGRQNLSQVSIAASRAQAFVIGQKGTNNIVHTVYKMQSSGVSARQQS